MSLQGSGGRPTLRRTRDTGAFASTPTRPRRESASSVGVEIEHERCDGLVTLLVGVGYVKRERSQRRWIGRVEQTATTDRPATSVAEPVGDSTARDAD